ncbi:MAG: response regulator, partial [Pseudomonadota bacterium]|nr:response regulator [Pseudomonadota bacterium]
MAPADVAQSIHTDIDIPLERAQILIVDDDHRMLALMSELLRLKNYNVTATNNGQHAIELLKERSFDLVLLDLNMPGIDGFGVMEHIELHARATPIIVVSGDNTIDSAILALRKG